MDYLITPANIEMGEVAEIFVQPRCDFVVMYNRKQKAMEILSMITPISISRLLRFE